MARPAIAVTSTCRRTSCAASPGYTWTSPLPERSPADPGGASTLELGHRRRASVGELRPDLAGEPADLGAAAFRPAADEVAIARVPPFRRVLARRVEIIERQRARPHDRRGIAPSLSSELVEANVRLPQRIGRPPCVPDIGVAGNEREGAPRTAAADPDRRMGPVGGRRP